jgi:hypothetical protein
MAKKVTKSKKDEEKAPEKPKLRDLEIFRHPLTKLPHREPDPVTGKSLPAMIDIDHQRYMINGQLHREDGPALEFFATPEDNLWLLNAVPLNEANTEDNPNLAQRIVEDPNSLTIKEVEGIQNLEIKRIAIERMGPGRYLTGVNAKVVHEGGNDIEGTKEVLMKADGILYFVGVCRSTGRTYFISVDPECKTVEDARRFMSSDADPKLCVGAS